MSQKPRFDDHAPGLAAAWNMKCVSKGKEYHGPCICCGGTDRARLTNHNGEIKYHCRKCDGWKEALKIAEREGLLPSSNNSPDNVLQFDTLKNLPIFSMDENKPYHENKGIPLIGAKLVGNNVIVQLQDITGENAGMQQITPTGKKRFTKGMDFSSGIYSFAGKLDAETSGIVYITEGWADMVTIFTCTATPTVFGVNASNIPVIVPKLRRQYPNAKFIVCADNDEPGLKAARDSKLPYIVPKEVGKDWNDIYRALGQQAVLNELRNVTKPSGGMFQLLADVRTRSPDWIADGILESDSLAIIFGGSGDGKTFIALDLSLSIAFGISFHGHAVQQGSVAYIAGEGMHGIKRRAAAFCKLRQVDLTEQIPFYLSKRGCTLDAETVPELIADLDEAVEHLGPIKLVVLDTLDRSIDGTEDDNSDTKRYLDYCDDIRAHFGCTVLVIAHVGHQARHRAKGSTKLRDRMDASYKVAASGDHYINFVPTKMKDAPEPDPITFGKVSVDVETDDGEIVSSLALEKIEMTTPGEKPKPDEIKVVIIREFAANADFGDMPFADLKRLAAMELNVSQKTVERYVKKLIDAKVFKIDGRSIIEGDAYAG